MVILVIHGNEDEICGLLITCYFDHIESGGASSREVEQVLVSHGGDMNLEQIVFNRVGLGAVTQCKLWRQFFICKRREQDSRIGISDG